jgi:hypothetical protein
MQLTIGENPDVFKLSINLLNRKDREDPKATLFLGGLEGLCGSKGNGDCFC